MTRLAQWSRLDCGRVRRFAQVAGMLALTAGDQAVTEGRKWSLCTIAPAFVAFASPLPGQPIPEDAGTPVMTPGATAAILLARAQADTVETGLGLVYTRAEYLRHDPRKIFGQTMDLSQIEGFGAEHVREVLASSGTREVVLVPWDYGAGCGPHFWNGSARWSTPDSLGVYTGTLRPDSLWVGGRPTFDVYFAEVSYAHGPRLRIRALIAREARRVGHGTGPAPQAVSMRNRPVPRP